MNGTEYARSNLDMQKLDWFLSKMREGQTGSRVDARKDPR